MIAAAGWLSTHQETLRVFSGGVVYSFLGLFIMAGMASAVMLVKQSSLVGYVGITAFVLSSVASCCLVGYASKGKRRQS